MKREIKFRAWDTDMREMVSVSGIQFDPYSPKEKPNIIDEHNDIRDLDEIKLMQFTGLKDKNGKEIYEGDIVKVLSSTYSIEYVTDLALFTICRERKPASYPFWDSINSEVIGNIYENPELLKS